MARKTISQQKTLKELAEYIKSTQFNPEYFKAYLSTYDQEALSTHSINPHGSKITLLGVATSSLNVEAVRLLLEYGADPRIPTKGPDSLGGTLVSPLYWVANPSKNSESPIDPNIRTKIMDLMLEKSTYDALNNVQSDLMSLVNASAFALQLLIHGASNGAHPNQAVKEAITNLLSKITKTPAECLNFETLHPNTLQSIGSTEKTIQKQAVLALKNGASPVLSNTSDTYTTYSLEALNLLREELSNPEDPKTIKTFLDISLDEKTKEYLQQNGVNFTQIADNAVIQIIQHGMDPLCAGSDIITDNAFIALSKVQQQLQHSTDLLLYSMVHQHSFDHMDDGIPEQIKANAIICLKNGTNPKCSDETITDHTKELINKIAEEVKTSPKEWLAICKLHQDTITLIDEALQTKEYSITILGQEIQDRLKNGEELSPTPHEDMPQEYLNEYYAIEALKASLAADPTLILRISLHNSTVIAMKSEYTKFIKNAITMLQNQDNIQFSSTLTANTIKILMLHPEAMLYIRDTTIKRIQNDLGEQYNELRDAAIQAVKEGAHIKIPNHVPTTFATGIFNDIIEQIKSGNTLSGITGEGIESLQEFAVGDKQTLEAIRKFAIIPTVELTPKTEPESAGVLGSITSTVSQWLWGTPPKPGIVVVLPAKGVTEVTMPLVIPDIEEQAPVDTDLLAETQLSMENGDV